MLTYGLSILVLLLSLEVIVIMEEEVPVVFLENIQQDPRLI